MISVDLRKKIALTFRYPRTAVQTLLDPVFYKNVATPFPRLIDCFITEACNFNCPMCHVRESRNRKMARLELKDIVKLAEEAQQFAPSFQLTGGEPLLHPDIVAIVRALTRRRLVKGLVTNGLLLKQRAAELVDAGLDFLAVSLDGPDEKTQYKRGYVKGSFEKILEGVKEVVKRRGNKPLPNIRVATVVSQINLHNFDEIMKIAEDVGADQWSISHYFYFFKKVKEMQKVFAARHKVGTDVWGEDIGKRKELFLKNQRRIIQDKYREIFKKIQSKKSRLRISAQDVDVEKYYRGEFPSPESVCVSPFRQLFLRGNGDIEMCQGYVLGNIKKNNLYKVWNGSKANHFRTVFRRYKIMPACFRCCALDIKFD